MRKLTIEEVDARAKKAIDFVANVAGITNPMAQFKLLVVDIPQAVDMDSDSINIVGYNRICDIFKSFGFSEEDCIALAYGFVDAMDFDLSVPTKEELKEAFPEAPNDELEFFANMMKPLMEIINGNAEEEEEEEEEDDYDDDPLNALFNFIGK